jgi:D-glycero-D-manno-heptose 1,7-bisphosphate phosphatase
MNKAIFIDKDGTLVTDVPYNINPELIRFEAYALEALLSLQQQGFHLVIISNQPGIGLGYFGKYELENVGQHIKELLLNNNIVLHGFYYCPHSPEAGCDCRKPAPGLIRQAAQDMEIDLSKSWMVGDILNDVEAGKRCGCKTILIDNGNETEWLYNTERTPHFMANDLKEAADIIALYPE